MIQSSKANAVRRDTILCKNRKQQYVAAFVLEINQESSGLWISRRRDASKDPLFQEESVQAVIPPPD